MAERNNKNPNVNSTKSGVSAKPQGLEPKNPDPAEPGPMNMPDAKESGYTDKNGHAVAMAKKDKKGSPTGAYTDVGAGRSSVVTKH